MFSENTIELKNISKYYPGVHALDAVNFTIRRGEIHCLVGQNGCGKSTLIKVLSGIEKPEPGAEIYINGERYMHLNSAMSMHKGIQVIYQDLSLFSNLTVKENIAFRGNRGKWAAFVNWKEVKACARRALDEIGVDLDLNKKVEELSIAQQQLVEIAKALTSDLSLLILDEPTASLTRREVNALFKVINRLQSKGISVLFVSHKLNEVFEIAQKVTIMRDGKMIGTYAPSELDHDRLVYLMTGMQELDCKPSMIDKDNEVVLEARHLTKARNYSDISFRLKKGEILGITGLLGSGRTELALTLFGMNTHDSGELLLQGEVVKWANNREALKAGIGYVPENRLSHGLIMDQTIVDNLTITTIHDYLNRLNLIDDSRRDKVFQRMVKELEIKANMPKIAVKTLSGGNQQKIVLAKWLLVSPKVLILDEPTIGIDVIAKSSIHALIRSLAEKGMSIIMISDEVQEVLNNCHRIFVMREGRFVCEYATDEISPDELLEKYNLA